jgi:hypothetical protein
MPRMSRNNNIHELQDNDENHVTTPLGEGMLVGRLEVRRTDNDYSRPAKFEYMVRIPITDFNRGNVGDSNCVTKHAKISGIWSFPIEIMEQMNPKLAVKPKDK